MHDTPTPSEPVSALAAGEISDGELVRRMRRGDQTAWALFVERYSRYVYAITSRAYRLSDSDAEDVFQDVFTRAYTHLTSLRSDDALRPWIGQLTRRLCVDKIRSTRREELTDDVDELAADETMERLADALSVRDALATLPVECRDVVDRFFCRDESYRQIGEALGIAAGTIASRISRCLTKLRTAYEGRKPAPAASTKHDD